MTLSVICFMIYITLINLVGFVIMGIDKKRAIRHAYRIPEATLFLIAIIGGSLGVLIGIHTFHHKTRRRKFTVGMPVILITTAGILILLLLLK